MFFYSLNSISLQDNCAAISLQYLRDFGAKIRKRFYKPITTVLYLYYFNFMTGIELKEKLVGKGIVLANLANSLGMSPQVLNARLNVKNVKIDFLRDVEKVVGFKLDNNQPSAEKEPVPYYVYEDLVKEISKLKQENDTLKRRNAVLEYQLQLFTEKEEKKAV